MARWPPIVNTGPWPPPTRIAVVPPKGYQDSALVRALDEGEAVPENSVAYRMVSRSHVQPGRGLVVGAQFKVERG